MIPKCRTMLSRFSIFVCILLCLYQDVDTQRTSCSTSFSSSTEEVILTDCGLDAFDLEVPTATRVLLGGNKITEVSGVFKNYPKLETLFLANNSITSFPSTLILPELTWLALHNNPLESFDGTGESLPKLRQLSLGGTLLKSFPKTLGTFSELQNLYFSEVDISNFNGDFPPIVETLNISYNSLEEIPSGIYKLKKLTSLHLEGNTLKPFSLTQEQFEYLSNLNLLYMTKPSSVDECGSPQRIQELSYREGTGKSPSTLNACVKGPFTDSTESSQSTTTNAEEYSSDKSSQHESSQNGSTRGDDIDDNTSSGFPWIYIVLGVLMISLLILGIVFWNSNFKPQGLQQGNGTAPDEDTPKDGNTAYKIFRDTMMEVIATNEHNAIIIPEEQSIGQLDTNSPKEQYTNVNKVATLYNNLQVYRIDLNDLIDIKSIGTGGFAVVWLVKYQNDRYLASKRLRTDDLKVLSPAQMEAFVQEIRMVSMLKHANIVAFVGIAWDGADQKVNLQMLFEYMEGGDLKDCLSKTNDDSQDTVLPRYWNQNKIDIARDIAAALVYLHSFRPPLLHRDLKARNVLLTGDYSTAKLSDFGVSRIRSQNNTTMTGGVGTGRWLAPEVVNGSTKYNESSDIYSFGIVLMELETHEIPYYNVRNQSNDPLPEISILYKVAIGELNPMINFSRNHEKGGHAGIYELAERCLSTNPDARPSAMDVAQELQRILKR